MARITAQDKTDFAAALSELDRLLRGGEADIKGRLHSYIKDRTVQAAKQMANNPSGPNFTDATSEMELMEFFI